MPIRDNAGVFPNDSVAMWQTLIIVAFLLLILYNLGAGLYYMLMDRGTTTRTVRSLSWRVGLSALLVLLLVLGIATGVIQPHGIQR